MSAIRGVRIRSITGASARLSSSARSPAADRSSRTARTAAASAWVSPMAANTTLNGSPPADACAAICAASSRWGRPATEKTGSFWPRTRVVSASMTETPVSTGSAGGSRSTGFSGEPGHRRGDVAGHRRPAVHRLAPSVAHPAEPVRADRDPQRRCR